MLLSINLSILKYHLLFANIDAYKTLFDWIDGFVIGVFGLDLFFKYKGLQQKKFFLKKYWLDTLAIFPFYLFFRLFAEAASLLTFSERLAESQRMFHEGVVIQEEGVRVVQEAEKLAKAGKELEIVKATKLEEVPKILRAFER